jgi:signal recognition particle GTPase
MSHSHDHAHGADAHAPHDQKNQDAELLEAVKAAAESMKASGKSPLPVTVLSGFLGAGKTTLMTQTPAQKIKISRRPRIIASTAQARAEQPRGSQGCGHRE